MTAMDLLPSDLEHMTTNFLDMIENEANSQFLDFENLNSEKLNDFINGDILHETQMEVIHDVKMEYDADDVNNSNWFQGLQWSDMSKVPQSLIDASNEAENTNPNLLVNPQSVLPMHSHHTVQNNNPTQQMNQMNSRNGIAVKINGQDAVLTPTQHPQIQYVTVQNVTTLTNGQIGYTVQPITICPQQDLVQHVGTVTSPSLTSPVLVEHLQNGTQTTHLNNNNNINNKNQMRSRHQPQEKVYPKPVYSYSCLIAMALKNSRTGNLPVSEIYNFMIDNFPYFKTAPDGWKNSVRHNLSLNKCFAKVDNGKPTGSHTRKGCLWGLNPAKVEKMEEEIVKWRKKDPESVKLSMSKPENLELIEQGKAGPPREEPDTPVKPEPASQVNAEPISHMQKHETVTDITTESRTPVKVQGQSHGMVHSHQQQQQQSQQQHVVIKREGAVMVNVEPEVNVVDVNPYDPSLPDIAVQNGLWDEDLTISVGSVTQHTPSINSSPLISPTYTGPTQYHGNISYTCMSPQGTRSPVSGMTPTKMYQQTPTKIYPQTPSKLVLA